MSLSKEEFISQNKLANGCIILEPWEDFRREWTFIKRRRY